MRRCHRHHQWRNTWRHTVRRWGSPGTGSGVSIQGVRVLATMPDHTEVKGRCGIGEGGEKQGELQYVPARKSKGGECSAKEWLSLPGPARGKRGGRDNKGGAAAADRNPMNGSGEGPWQGLRSSTRAWKGGPAAGECDGRRRSWGQQGEG